MPCEHRHVFTHPVAKLCPLKTSHLNQRKITLGPAATFFFWYQLRARGKVQIAHCIGASLSVAQHPARVRSFALSALRRAGRVGVGRGGASQVRCSLALVLCVGAALLGTTHVFALLVGRLGLLLLVTPLLLARLDLRCRRRRRRAAALLGLELLLRSRLPRLHELAHLLRGLGRLVLRLVGLLLRGGRLRRRRRLRVRLLLGGLLLGPLHRRRRQLPAFLGLILVVGLERRHHRLHLQLLVGQRLLFLLLGRLGRHRHRHRHRHRLLLLLLLL